MDIFMHNHFGSADHTTLTYTVYSCISLLLCLVAYLGGMVRYPPLSQPKFYDDGFLNNSLILFFQNIKI